MTAAALPTGSVLTTSSAGARAVAARHAARDRDGRVQQVLALSALMMYLTVAAWLSAHDLVFPDAMSRVANGYYVLFSRDPHLAAIGFVWNPLPSLLTMPLLLATPLWPALAGHALAGCIVSSLCGAYTVGRFHGLTRDLGAGPATAAALTVLMAVHPLVLLSAATGASEAMLLAVCVYTARHLLRWLQTDDPWALVHVGLGTGLAYLVRYEALAIGVSVGLLVLCVSLLRARRRSRPWTVSLLDVTLAVTPLAATFALWSLASRIIMGSWLETFTSQYGNSAQVGTARETIDAVTGGTGMGHAAAYLLAQLVHTAPLAPPLLLFALVAAWVRADVRILAPTVVLGAVLGFQELTFLFGMSFGWMRFQIAAVPLGLLAAACLCGAVRSAGLRSDGHRLPAAFVTLLLVVGLTIAMPLAWIGEADPLLAREETLARESASAGQYVMTDRIASDIDAMSLPDGSVVTDVAYSFAVVLASDRPKQFVITPDRDFTVALNDPGGYGVRFALVTSRQDSSADAVATRYPGIFDDGGGVATLARQWQDDSGFTWRLYRFDDETPSD